jgi:rhodanese-related sulfurtransferase
MNGERVSAEEARRLYLSGGALMVDARPADAYERSGEQIPGDIRIPADRAEVWKQILPTGHTIVVYCTSPEEECSMQVARVLLNGGWQDVRVLRGGFDAWKGIGGPAARRVKPHGGT